MHTGASSWSLPPALFAAITAFHVELDAPVLRAARLRAVERDRIVRARAARRHAIASDTARGQVVPHRVRALLRQIDVVVARPGAVGVADDLHVVLGIRLQAIGGVVERRLRAAGDAGAVHLEADAGHRSARAADLAGHVVGAAVLVLPAVARLRIVLAAIALVEDPVLVLVR